MTRLLLLLSVFVSFTLLAQTAGVWENQTSMRKVYETAFDGNNLWSATEGGVFFFNSADSSYKRYTKSEGLSGHRIFTLAVDNSGEVWCGTSQGYINIIDPEKGNVTVKNEIAGTDFAQKGINDFVVSGDTVYVASDIGISVVLSGSYEFSDTYLKLGSFSSGIPVTTISLIEGQIYAGTPYGIAVSKPDAINLAAPESWDNYPITASNGSTINHIFKYQGNILAASDYGVEIVSGQGNWTDILSGQEAKKMIAGEDDLVILTDKRVYSFNGTTTEEMYNAGEQLHNIVSNKGNYYISTNNGILVYSSSTAAYKFVPDGPLSNSFLDIAVDGDGEIWVASGRDIGGNGVYHYKNNKWTNYTRNDFGTINNGFHQVSAMGDNSVYISSWGDGFIEYKDGVFTHFDMDTTGMAPVSGTFLVIYDLGKDSKNNLWVLNYESSASQPLSVKTDTGWIHYTFGPPLSANVATTQIFAIDQYDTKWFGVSQKSGTGPGLYFFNENGTLSDLSDDRWGMLDKNDGLADNEITALEIDKRGELWIGTPSGISILADPSDPFSEITFAFSMRQQSVTALAVDPLNRKWVGTTEGVYLISEDGRDVITSYNETNSPLASNDINSITVDENTGTVYFGTELGMSSLTTNAASAGSTFDELFIYPNPVLLQNGNPPVINVKGLAEDSMIKIFTISGKLVTEFDSPGGSIATWDGRDRDGNLVASGVYLLIAYNEDASEVATAKIAVVKK